MKKPGGAMTTEVKKVKLPVEETTVQHVRGYCTYVDLKLLTTSGVLFLRTWKRDIDGAKHYTHKEVIDVSEIPGMDTIHDGDGWYMPMIAKALRLMDDAIATQIAVVRFMLTTDGKEALAVAMEEVHVESTGELPPFLENK